jgi:predicted AlkP superfamily pyrophosphatase or phosphodiesterase
VFVVGVDGLTPDLVEPMMRDGRLPALAQIAETGSYGPLGTISPTNSSLLWTTIATGRHHDDHGIDGFQFYRICGVRVSRSAFRKYGRWGLRALTAIPRLLGLRKRIHFDGRHVKEKTFWDIVSEGGRTVGMVNWWHSWPARPVNGFVVTDRLHYWRQAWRGKEPVDSHLVYPPGMLEELKEIMIPPASVEPERIQDFVHLDVDEIQEVVSAKDHGRHPAIEVRFLLSADGTYSRVFHHCLDKWDEVDLAAVYFRGTDIAQHCAFGYMPSATASDATPEEREAFGDVVPKAYEFADGLVGQVLERMRPEDTLLLMSDHGYARQVEGGRHGPYGHALYEPPGVVFACGNGFRQGVEIEGADVYDIAPTALRMCGFPAASNFEGRCLEELVTEEFRRKYPVPEPIHSYGPRLPRSDAAVMSEEVSKEVTDHLRALGYLE